LRKGENMEKSYEELQIKDLASKISAFQSSRNYELMFIKHVPMSLKSDMLAWQKISPVKTGNIILGESLKKQEN
jgi:hypothetical protein